MRAAVRLRNLLKPKATGRQFCAAQSLESTIGVARSVHSSRHSITASQTGSWSGIDENVSSYEGDGAEQTSEVDENVVDAPWVNGPSEADYDGRSLHTNYFTPPAPRDTSFNWNFRRLGYPFSSVHLP